MSNAAADDEKGPRSLWLRLLGRLRALAWRRKPPPALAPSTNGPDQQKETRPIQKSLLVVVRNGASLDRVQEVLHAIDEDLVLAVKFTVDVGSKFAKGITERLRGMGADVIGWEEATGRAWDAIYAAHVNSRLGELRGPMLVTPHGVSYNRLRDESTGGDRSYPVGLSPFELISNGRFYPALLGLCHPSELSRTFPEARERAEVLGDLVMDKLLANKHLRRKIRDRLRIGERRLICVSSTHGGHSTVGTQLEMIKRLLVELPSDEYAVVLVAHPNVWIGGSPLELRLALDDELASGLVVVDMTTWQAALVAADLVIGDHGSVTNYAVGLELPVLTAANGVDEMHPASAVTWLHADLPQLDHAAPLRPQIEKAFDEHYPERWRDYTEEIFGLPGKGLEATANALRALMNEPSLRTSPRTRPVDMPEVHEGDPITAYRVPWRGEGYIARHPAIVAKPGDFNESVLVVLAEEVCPVMRDNAEIIVHTGPLPTGEAEGWIKETWDKCPKPALIAAATDGGGTLLVFCDGTRVTTARGDPFVAAVALYWWKIDGNPCTAREFVMTMGAKTHTVVVS